MKRFILLTVILTQAIWANSSLVVNSGTSGVLKVPAITPFTSLGDYRVELRIHDWSVPSSPYTAYVSWGSVYSGARYLEIGIQPSGAICAFDWVDSLSRGNNTCADLTGHNDVIVRVQRFGNSYASEADTVGAFLLEAWDINGTPIVSFCHVAGSNFACPISGTSVKDWSGTAGYMGNPSKSTAFSLAWLKWFSATVPPGSPFSQESTPADLADWRFENNLNNQGTGGYNASIGAFNNGPSFGASRSYPPTCVAGAPQVFRAGYPAQLDGTGSYALDGGSSLRYFWRQLSGPTKVLWSGQNPALSGISRTAAGSYTFQLTVTDSSGNSSSCTVKDGFVATDANNVVITQNPVVDTLLGPMIRYGANPWPWFDDRHTAYAAEIISSLTNNYTAFWTTTQGPGTIAIATGSTAVTGSGTTFTTTFCQGPANPSVPKANTPMILVWYPDSSQEGYGLRDVPVASCQSDTQLTLSHGWYGDVADCSSGGCSYSYDDSTLTYGGLWTYPNGEGSNYYDAVAGLYALYYRTGLDDYLTAARTLADRFWKYRLDSGTKCDQPYPNACGGTNTPRTQSMLGMVLRAMDGRPDMWPGIRNESRYWEQAHFTGLKQATIYDIREQAYSMAFASYVALFDPDAASRATAKTAISWAINNLWSLTQHSDGSWQQIYTSINSWTPTTSASLTNGSTSVIGDGTNWTAAQFPANTHIIFLPTSSAPANYEAQEPTYYTATWVDGTHLTLDKPYQGTTGTHGWMAGYGLGGTLGGAVGWGAQPFIEGILGTAFGFAAQAIADTDPANAALARSYVVSIANWEKNVGYRPGIGGMQYFAGTVDCQPPIPESATWCTAGDNATQARTLSAESLRSVMLAYSYTADLNLLAFADTLYNAMYAKAGTCPNSSSLCVPDGQYITDLNSGLGWYMYGNPTTNKWHKYFGMFFGIGAGADWPAYRMGGAQPGTTRLAYVGFNPEMIAGAARVRVTTTAPDGQTIQTSCTSSPCAVPIDNREGDHLFQMEYLSASGAVLAATEIPAVQGR